jgi:protein-disulfide isomerase
MQKKNRLPDTSASSNWQENLKKQERANGLKKIGIWAGIIAICIVGFAGLVYFVNKSTGSVSVAGREEPNLPKVSGSDIIVGNPEAKETIIEYGDMQCPACAAYNPIVNQVLATYKDQVRLVYRFFPLPQHQNALIGAQGAYAAWKMGKFPEMKDKMFDAQAQWESLSDADAQAKFIGFAKEIGLDQDKFKSLMNSQEAKDFVQHDKNEANTLGLNSTPTFFLGNKLITPNGFDSFKSLIDSDLKATK